MSELSERDAAHNAATMVRLRALVSARFAAATNMAFASIVHGSPLTGAPGQPVAPIDQPNAGKLRDSWAIERPDPNTAIIGSTASYASDVEENVHDAHFHTGGPHGVKLTAANFDRLLDAAQREAAT